MTKLVAAPPAVPRISHRGPRCAGRAPAHRRIVAAAIEILDAGGEGALTFRALAARLAGVSAVR
ncbi:MAG TPA: hypothetical protein VGM79_02175 [Streptosporangiaceae bacterium]|jgi:AcrR family transcriptional regulator